MIHEQANSGSNPEGFRSIEEGLVLNLLVNGDITRKDEGGT
jgi:hypothetical protein